MTQAINQPSMRDHKRTIGNQLFKVYGPDGAGIEYWYPRGTRAVRLTRCHKYVDARYCQDCKDKDQPQQYAFHTWSVDLATGGRAWDECNGTFVHLMCHADFECAARHLLRIHAN